jgi:hypothetical protein
MALLRRQVIFGVSRGADRGIRGRGAVLAKQLVTLGGRVAAGLGFCLSQVSNPPQRRLQAARDDAHRLDLGSSDAKLRTLTRCSAMRHLHD